MTRAWAHGRRLLSADEAEAVLRQHFVPGLVEACVRSGSYIVWWSCPDTDPHDGDETAAESSDSFEPAIRELGRLRPDLVSEPLDAPQGLLRRLTVREREPAGVAVAAIEI